MSKPRQIHDPEEAFAEVKSQLLAVQLAYAANCGAADSGSLSLHELRHSIAAWSPNVAGSEWERLTSQEKKLWRKLSDAMVKAGVI